MHRWQPASATPTAVRRTSRRAPRIPSRLSVADHGSLGAGGRDDPVGLARSSVIQVLIVTSAAGSRPAGCRRRQLLPQPRPAAAKPRGCVVRRLQPPIATAHPRQPGGRPPSPYPQWTAPARRGTGRERPRDAKCLPPAGGSPPAKARQQVTDSSKTLHLDRNRPERVIVRCGTSPDPTPAHPVPGEYVQRGHALAIGTGPAKRRQFTPCSHS